MQNKERYIIAYSKKPDVLLKSSNIYRHIIRVSDNKVIQMKWIRTVA